MSGKYKFFRNRLCIAGLVAASVFAGVAAPVAVSMTNVEVAEAATTVSASRVISYFNGQVGQKKLSGWCLKFCDDGYEALGAKLKRYGSAREMANDYNLNTSKNPPVGAFVFFKGVKNGHVGIWVGDGVVATQGMIGENKPIAKMSIDAWTKGAGAYLGWCIPRDLNIHDDLNSWPIEDGYYTLKTAVGNRFLDVAGMGTADRTNVQIWDAYGAHSGQIFRVGKNSMRTGYFLENLNSKTFVDTTISGRNQANPVGADNVMIFHGDGTDGQQWRLEDAGNGNFFIKNLYGYYLDVCNGVNNNGTNVGTWHKNGSAAQQWKLTRVSGKNLANIADGDYMIYSKVGNKVLNASGNKTENSTNLEIWDPNTCTGNIFTVQKDGRFVTKIKSKAANRMVDSCGGTNAPENVQLFDYNNGYGQNWYVEDAGDGYVYIRNLWGYYLDVDSGVDANGRNVNTWYFNGSNAQKWKFVKYTKTNVTGITLNTTSQTAETNSRIYLYATVSPSNATNKKVIWSSSNTNVATVDASGIVATKNPGTAQITAKTEDGGKTATCNVTVKAKNVDTRTGIYYVNNQWTYLKNGKIYNTFTGLVYGNNQWYYMTGGIQNKNYVGLCQYNGSWWYIKKGSIDKSFTDIVDYNKNSWYVRNGKVDKNYTGLAYCNNVWWYVKQGFVGKSHRGLVYYNNKWWYVNRGKLDKNFNNLFLFNNKWWYIKNGTIDKSFKGLFKYNGNLWYVVNGTVDKNYNGKVTYNGKTVTVKDGWGGKA